MKLLWAALFALSLMAVSCGGSSGTTTGLGSRSDAITFFTGQGFTGSESPLADGTPRWLARGPHSSGGEVEGAGSTASKVSVTVIGDGQGGTIAGTFLGHFAPGSTDFMNSVVDAAKISDQDQTRTIAGRTVEIQSLSATDGVIFVLTVS